MVNVFADNVELLVYACVEQCDTVGLSGGDAPNSTELIGCSSYLFLSTVAFRSGGLDTAGTSATHRRRDDAFALTWLSRGGAATP